MSLIFEDNDKSRPITHTDSYIVDFYAKGQRLKLRFYTSGKNKHDIIKKHFEKKFPKVEVICVSYE